MFKVPAVQVQVTRDGDADSNSASFLAPVLEPTHNTHPTLTVVSSDWGTTHTMQPDEREEAVLDSMLELILHLMRQYEVRDWRRWPHQPGSAILDNMHEACRRLTPKFVRMSCVCIPIAH